MQFFTSAIDTLQTLVVALGAGPVSYTHLGAMFVAVIVRNLNEKFNFYNFDFAIVDGIGDVMLSLYLSIALMTLKLWELAGPVSYTHLDVYKRQHLWKSDEP